MRSLSLPKLCLGLIFCFGTVFAQTLTVLTHDSFAMSEDVIEAFTDKTGIELEFLPAGDAGEVLNRAILTKANPLGDVLYGIDNSLLARALAEDIFESYESPALDLVDERYLLEPAGLVTPIDVGYVNFNLDKAYFEEAELELPTDISDLTEERYRGLTVVENPATSSPGLAFMLATIDRFGLEGDYTWLHFWQDLRDNDVQVTSGWSDAYYTAFSRYGGDKPIVLSYASSPAAEVIFSEEPLDTAPTLNLFCDACVYEQIEAAGILKGSKNIEAAKTFIDFMLGLSFQEAIPGTMFVYPVVKEASLPEAFEAFSKLPASEDIASLDSKDIEEHLKTWLNEWTQVVEQGVSADEVR